MDRPLFGFQVDTFTAGTVATSRNEGINKHVKTNLNQRSSLKTVVVEVNQRSAYQDAVSGHEDFLTQMNTKEAATSAAQCFPSVFKTIEQHCTKYTLSDFTVQARIGVTDYKLVGRLENECPENSPEHMPTWGGADWATTDETHNALLNTDFAVCDFFRSTTITEFVANHVPDGDYVCYAVAHQRADTTKAPQIVVLYGKHETSNEHEHNAIQYLKFFCTCGFSTR